MTSWVGGPRRSSKALPKAKLPPKKGHGHFWWSASGLIHCSFLNPGKTIISEKYAQQISEMHWKAKCPQWTGLWSFASCFIFTWPSPTNYHFFKHLNNNLAGRMLPQPAGCRKCFPRVHSILKHRFVCYRKKQTFLIGKIVLIVMVPILINRDMAEPSYNYLKFKVWNLNYFYTNMMFSWSLVLICLEQLRLKPVQSSS